MGMIILSGNLVYVWLNRKKQKHMSGIFSTIKNQSRVYLQQSGSFIYFCLGVYKFSVSCPFKASRSWIFFKWYDFRSICKRKDFSVNTPFRFLNSFYLQAFFNACFTFPTITPYLHLNGLLPILWSTGTGVDVMNRIAAPWLEEL